MRRGAACQVWDGGIPIPPKVALGELELTHPNGIKNRNNNWEDGVPIPPKIVMGGWNSDSTQK